MKLVDSVLSFLLSFLNILLSFLYTCPFLELIELLEDYFVVSVGIKVLSNGFGLGYFSGLLELEFLFFDESLMGEHVFLVDSEDLREIEYFDIPFLECFAADSSVDYFLVIFVVYSNNLLQLFLSHVLRFELIQHFGSQILQFLLKWIVNC